MHPQIWMRAMASGRATACARLNELAVLSLICSILGFVLLPGIGPVAGLILGRRAQREIAASAGQQYGDALADWGISLGYGGLLFLALTLAGVALSFIITPGRP